MNTTLEINEIFYSIQGESTRAGWPCVFVRLQGCSLRCSWCDTKYAISPEGPHRTMQIDEILSEVRKYPCRYVTVTGGEPLRQPNVHELLTRLAGEGFCVGLETNGWDSVARVDSRIVKVMDVKCPSSGMGFRLDNLEYITATDEIKFVIAGREDYKFARDFVRTHSLVGRARAVLFSAVAGLLEPKQLAEWILEDSIGVALQLQLHKYIWGADAQGV